MILNRSLDIIVRYFNQTDSLRSQYVVHDYRWLPNFFPKTGPPHLGLFTIPVVQHCSAISATAELLLLYIVDLHQAIQHNTCLLSYYNCILVNVGCRRLKLIELFRKFTYRCVYVIYGCSHLFGNGRQVCWRCNWTV